VDDIGPELAENSPEAPVYARVEAAIFPQPPDCGTRPADYRLQVVRRGRVEGAHGRLEAAPVEP
jgi:hypothetical protein